MTTIGRYEIRGELGRGGMATVMRAYDPMFKRDVAVKVLPREFLHDPAFRARFEREAQVVAALEHSAIVPVYDYGENAETGQPFIVMRLMSGGTLAEKLRGQPMDLNEVARILSRLAPALDFAHARGVVHRDLKPGNILFDGEGNPYISDFGLAKLAESNVNLTGTGLMGTPAYMSPEQARGEKEIDGRSDLYALGAIVYQMLTGRQPYEAPTPIAVVLKHVNEPPPSLRAVRPDLPVNAEAIIHKAMAKDPTTRYPTAASLSSDLAALTTNTAAALGSGVGSGAWSMSSPMGDSRTVAVPLNPASSPPSSGSGSIAPAPRSGIAGCSTGLIAGVAVAGVLVIAAALCIAGVINLGPLSALAGLATATPSATEPPPTAPPATETTIPPTRTRRPTRTPLPTRTPGATSTSAPEGQSLVRDDFASDAGVWSVGDYSDSAFEITNGAYIITIKDTNLIAWGNYEPQTYANVSISTEATDLSDLPQSSKNWPGFGLICGYVDNNNFYYAGVTADGYYVVNKYQNGDTVGLSSSDGKWAKTNDIVPFQKSYNVRLVCADGYLSLYVDDKRIEYVADSDLGEGLLGIFVNSFDASGVTVSFDNVIIESAR